MTAAMALAKEFREDRIEIPKCVRLLAQARNTRIHTLRAEGWTIRALALEFGMTERAITKILKS